MIKFHYLDANCLVKLVIDEPRSSHLRNYFFQTGVVCASTTFCYYEALGVLKGKWLNTKRPDHISDEQYFAACQELCAMVEDGNIKLDEIPLANRATFNESETIATIHKIDLSDALQLVTLKRGMFARLNAGEAILVSEDGNLLIAAEKQNLKAVNIENI